MRCYARLNQTSPATLHGAGERLATRRPRGQENGWEVDSGGAGWATEWARAGGGKGRLIIISKAPPSSVTVRL